MTVSETRVAVVTGGGTGIGTATAALLSEDGFEVAVLGRRLGPLKDVADGIGGSAYECDVRAPESVVGTVERVLADHSRIDALVNCAGVIQAAVVEDLTADHIALLLTGLRPSPTSRCGGDGHVGGSGGGAGADPRVEAEPVAGWGDAIVGSGRA